MRTETQRSEAAETSAAALENRAGASTALLGLEGHAQRLAVVRTFSVALVVAGNIGAAIFVYYWSTAPAHEDAFARGSLLLVAFISSALGLCGLVARRLCRHGRLRAATHTMALALITVATSDLVLIAHMQAIAILIYFVAIGIATFGLDTREWPWLTAAIGTAAALGSFLQYFPIVTQVQLSGTFLGLVTVLATTAGLCFPMGLFWMFSKSLTASQARAWQLAQSLTQAHQLKSEFFNSMSHELRSPLQVIIGYAEILREGASGPWTDEQVYLLERISKYAVELVCLVQSTLDLSRIESGRMPMHIEPFALRDTIAEVEEAIALLPKPDTVTLHWDVEPDLPVLVTDRLKLKEIVQNLVTNAVKFTPSGRIETRVTRAGGDAVIVVRDSGIGIRPEDLSLIFEPFGQAGSSANGLLGGVGLGLYIVKRLVELLGGTIDVDSTLGGGTAFHVRVPLRHPSREAVPGEPAA